MRLLYGCSLWLWCYRNSCPSIRRQSDSNRPLLANRVSAAQLTENTETAHTAPVHHPSITEANVFTNCSVESLRKCRQHISRLSSSESAECPGSILDYHSTRPSVDLSDFCSDSNDLDDMSVGSVNMDTSVDGKSIGDVILEKEEKETATVSLPQPAEVTSVHMNMNCHVIATSAVSKSERLPASSGLPSAVSSSRMQSRLPAPRSHATAVAASGSRYASKSDQLANGLTLTSVATSSASFSTGTNVGPSRFR